MVLTIIPSFFVGRYIRPQFFYNNPLLSFIQFVIGPYTDDLGNVLPYAVEGVGVPVDPLAFAGLLGEFLSLLNPFAVFTVILLPKQPTVSWLQKWRYGV